MENKLFIVRYEIKTRTVEEDARGKIFNSLLDLGMSAVSSSSSNIIDFQLVWAKDAAEAGDKFEAFIDGQKELVRKELNGVLTTTDIQISEALI